MLRLGMEISVAAIPPVSFKPDYFPKARMHDSSILIDLCLGTSVVVCLCVPVS